MKRGFTLVEVLIAMLILFLSVSTALTAYQTNLKASESAVKTVNTMALTEPLMVKIRNELRQRVLDNQANSYSESGIFLNASYQWQANLAQSAPPPPRFREETVGVANYQERFYLYDIELTIQLNRQQQTLSYQELAWSEYAELQDGQR